jgi:hypothetical protein
LSGNLDDLAALLPDSDDGDDGDDGDDEGEGEDRGGTTDIRRRSRLAAAG